MAHVYVDSGAAGAGTGADWANAYTTLEAAVEAAGTAAGDSIWVAHDHAETRASGMGITFKNTSAVPGTVMCVNRAGSVPPVAADLRTTATVTTTGASDISFTGFAYLYGITFSAGQSLILASGEAYQYFKNCVLKMLYAGVAGLTVGGGFAAAQRAVFDNTSVGFGHIGGYLNLNNSSLVWKNTTSVIAGAIIPTSLFGTGAQSILMAYNVDFSALGAGKTIMDASFAGVASFRNCKFDASVVPSGTPSSSSKFGVTFVNCDSGDTNYRTEKYAYEGTLTTETTVILSGGAGDGTTPIAWKIVTNADAELMSPFESLPISIWNETTGSRTVTVQGTWTAGSLPNNDDIWMEVEYLGNSGSTLGSVASTGLANLLATPVALAAGDGTWGGSTTKFKMTSTITVAKKGPIQVKVFVAAPLATIYINPKVVLS
jgi:hypothetical protein